MLTRKAMEVELVKRYGTTNIWFIDHNYNTNLEDLSNKEIFDLYNKSKGQYKHCKIFTASDLRRQTYNDMIIVVTNRNFVCEDYFEHQWDPAFNNSGFKNGLKLNAYKDNGNLIRIFSSTAVEKINDKFYIGDYFASQPNEGCEVI